ncbi:MAG: ParB N-terminal domain-containing protein [Polyangiaceae bacterium]|nr:ParB N-terminal domain-containing protein [Polyangiaceae bacterium]
MGGSPAQVVYNEATGVDETLYLHSEALGSVGLVTDNQGVETERTFFDPFGEKVKDSGEVMSPLLGDVKLGFTGHRHDDDLGLINMIGRIYSPVQKRFLSTDPLISDPFFGQSYNRYSYVVNNPLRYTDPTGYVGETPQTPYGPGNQEQENATVPTWPVVLDAAVTEVRPEKVDDTGSTPTVVAPVTVVVGPPEPPEPPPPPPPPPPGPEAKKTWFDVFGRMVWGAGKHLVASTPPVAIYKAIRRNVQLVTLAAKNAAAGEFGLAAYQILEIPHEGAKHAASIVTGPIKAVLTLPATIQTAVDSNTDPEDRGVAVVQTVQAIATIVATAAAVGGGKGGGGPASGARGGGKTTIPLELLESPKTNVPNNARYQSAAEGVRSGNAPPIEVEPTGRGTFRIQDGVRRSVAAREQGKGSIEAVVRQPTPGAPKTVPLKDVQLE